MNNKICTALLLIFACIGLAGCGSKSTYTNKEYVIATTESKLQRTQIDLNSYRIQGGAIISLSDLINVNNMSLVMAGFYDDDNLLLLYTDDKCTMLDAYLFSLIYGELQWQGRIENISGVDGTNANYYPVSMEPLVIMESNTRKLWVISGKEVQSELVLTDASMGGSVSDSKGIYYINGEQDTIQKADYLTGMTDTVFSEVSTYSYEIRNLDYISDDGRYLYATGINRLNLSEITFVIDIQSNELAATVEGIIASSEGKNSFYSIYQQENGWAVQSRLIDDYNSVKEYQITPQVYFDYFVMDNDVLVTEENDGSVYRFSCYDLLKGQQKGYTQIDFGAYFRDTYAEGDGYSYCLIDNDYAYNSWRNMVVFEIISESNNRKVFLWDINSAEAEDMEILVEEYTASVDINAICETEYDGLSDRLHNIYQEYGVAVYVGNNTPGCFTDYTALTVENVQSMSAAVECVINVLECYPDGFFDFFKTKNYSSGINIYLVGDMTPLSENYVSNPSGFSTSMKEFDVMAVNINYADTIEQNLCHEISHAIYDRINFEEMYSGNTYFDETKWMELNPKDFEYYGAYLDGNGREYGEPQDFSDTAGNSDINQIYFVDAYSKTFITEDLARLMEYNMVFQDSDFLDSPHLKAKMKFYSEAIRKVWNSKNWPETTAWEVNNE